MQTNYSNFCDPRIELELNLKAQFFPGPYTHKAGQKPLRPAAFRVRKSARRTEGGFTL